MTGISPHLSSMGVNLDTQETPLEVTMQAWTNNSFTLPLEDDYIVEIPEKLHIGLTVSDGKSSMVLQGRKCWATAR